MAAAARTPIIAERIELWSDGAAIASAGIVVAGNDLPEVIMLDGLPFVRDLSIHHLAYRRVRPYCISKGN